jgi:hypothetical protein
MIKINEPKQLLIILRVNYAQFDAVSGTLIVHSNRDFYSKVTDVRELKLASDESSLIQPYSVDE